MSSWDPKTRIAVAHEWLTNWAGSERVAKQMVELTGCDELVSSVVEPELARRHFAGTRVRPLWTSGLPHATTHWTRYAPAMIAAWAGVKIRADVLLCSSHFAAHGATLRFEGPSVVYYHTPARMVWRPDIELTRIPHGLRGATNLALPPLRAWDRHVAQRPTTLLANSTAVAARIEEAYGRTATVLHPPVDVDPWLGVERKEARHLLYFGRLVAYKKPWVAVEAARLTGVPLVVIGDGPERARLERAAPPNVRFLGHAPDREVREAMAAASALVFPGEEDFGIAPVEALAAGVPVLAYAAGGALDYIDHGRNGLLVPDQDPTSFAAAIRSLPTLDWSVDAVRGSARRFGVPAFRRGLAAALRAVAGPAHDGSAAAPRPSLLVRTTNGMPL